MKDVIFYLNSINRIFVESISRRNKRSIQNVMAEIIEFAIERQLHFEKEISDRIKTQIRIEETILSEFDRLCLNSQMSRTEYIKFVLEMYQHEMRRNKL